MRLTPFSLLALGPLLAGCPNTDAAVFVDPSIDAPTLTVQSNALGTSLSGSFSLGLHLGARASGLSQVSLGQFEIQDASMKTSIVSPLVLDAGTTMLPVIVAPDSDVTVSLTFDTGAKPLSTDLAAALCDPAGVVITGTIQDSLQTGTTPVDSAIIKATGCN